jgi:hypothetical protein
MMNVREFNFQTDWDTICSWWKEYGDVAPNRAIVPPTGFISDVAAGFLMKTDTSLSIIEYLIVKKDFKDDRKQAIKDIVLALMNHAKQIGYLEILGISDRQILQEVAQELGFKIKNKIFLERAL